MPKLLAEYGTNKFGRAARMLTILISFLKDTTNEEFPQYSDISRAAGTEEHIPWSTNAFGDHKKWLGIFGPA